MKLRFLACPAALLTMALLSSCGGGTGEVQGTISGLDADGLVLTDGSETLAVDAGSTSFEFSTLLDEGDDYSVTVTTQPTGLECTVTGGTGTISATADVAVTISCAPAFTLSGTVTGLTGNGLVLTDGSTTIEVAAGAATFAFVDRLATGTAYAISVETQPSGQTCSVANASGTVGSVAVTDLAVSCD